MAAAPNDDLNLRLLEGESNVDVEAEDLDAIAAESIAESRSFWKRRRGLWITAVVLVVAGIIVVSALAGTNQLNPNSRPAAASTDPALAAMPAASVSSSAVKGYTTYSMPAFTGSVDTHTSSLQYTVDVSEDAVVLEDVAGAVAIYCDQPFSVPPSINASIPTFTTGQALLTVDFHDATVAQKYASEWTATGKTLLVLTANWGCGYAIRRITSLSSMSGYTVVFNTESAQLGDVLYNAQVQYSLTARNDTASRERRFTMDASKSASFDKTFTLFSGSKDGFTADITASVSASLSFTVNLDFSLHSINSFESTVTTEGKIALDASVTASYEQSATLASFTTEYAEIASFVVYVGIMPVPISVNIGAKGSVKAGFSASGHVTGGISLSNSASGSISYSDGHTYSSVTRKSPQFTAITPTASYGASGYVQASIGPILYLKMFYIGGPTLDVMVNGEVNGAAGTSSSCGSSPSIDCLAWINVNAGARLDYVVGTSTYDAGSIYESAKLSLYHTCV